ncbi:hypothetical protein COM97_27145 [Bacillus thuringiensis]|uniref:hypothetical protein n=1 Tax=Bacillus thuringiensis TaxID=1428 RepID=UPI000BEE4993|nr:hypothetical protein [Bacillus thuringiensis]PEF03420.1 hypothetical protein COM97_27145 [Bacillus thuringiensis]
MEQLNLFEMNEVTEITTQTEETVFEFDKDIERVELSKMIVEEAFIESIAIDRSLAPTWQVTYFDKAKRERMDWFRCEDEEEARKELRKKTDDILSIKSVQESKYSIEEIELLD